MMVENIFNNIYQNNKWGSKESVSGTGSELKVTKNLQKELPLIFKKYDIKTILDLPCGDFNWMSKIDLNGIDYLGADIVPGLIDSNKIKHPNYKFDLINIINDTIPKKDLIIVRDCFVHLTYKNIDDSIKNIKKSGSKYLLTTTFLTKNNKEINNDGDWRAINLFDNPFNLKNYLYVFNDGDPKYYGEKNSDKSMVLYDISKL